MTSSSLLLAALPDRQRDWFAANAMPVALEAREVLAEPDLQASAVLLLVDAVAARLAVHHSGAIQEAGLTGPGALACAFALVGNGTSPWRIEVRRGGTALRLDATLFHKLDQHAPTLRRLAQSIAANETAQLAASFAVRNCRNAVTCVAERLLDYFETLGEPILEVTHIRLAELLGLRRATVTLALQQLEADHALRARRGAIELLNRDRLAAISQMP